MKILYDHKIFSMQRFGGISRYVCEVAERVLDAESGLVVGALYDNSYLSVLAKQGKVSGVPLPHIRKTGKARNKVNKCWVQLQVAMQRPDIFHETYFGAPVRLPRGTKRVITVHDMLHEQMPHYFGDNAKDSDWKMASIAQADGIVCISAATESALRATVKGRLPPIRVIHHGFNLGTPAKSAVQDMWRLTGGRPYLLYVGKRDHYKNFGAFWHAYLSSQWAQQGYPVVCFGGEPLSDDERARLEAQCKGGLITVTGPDELLWAAYAGAAAFVYPSLAEGFGMPLLEAFAAGCPVICTDIPVFREIAGNGAHYFQTQGELTVLLNNFLSPAAVDPLKEAAAAVLRRFSWERCAQEHRDFYREILAS